MKTDGSMSGTQMDAGTLAGTAGGGAGAPEGLYERAKRGWPEDLPLVQFPNTPLLVAMGALLLTVLTSGTVSDAARATFYAALAAWGWLELTEGANWVRRMLGAAAMVFVVVMVGDALGD